MTTVVIQAANFWPWLGWFDKAAKADWFVMGDQTQIGDAWRRTLIAGPQGAQWLTMPLSSGRTERIDQARIAELPWRTKLSAKLQTAYARHSHWELVEQIVTDLHSAQSWELLRDLNEKACERVARMLGSTATFVRASQIAPEIDDREDRILAYCRAVGATTLLSGPNARRYRDYARFRDAGIEVVHHSYPVPAYEQRGQEEFVPYMSVLDALANIGAEGTKELLTGRFDPP